MSETFTDLLDRLAEQDPGAPAISCDDARLSRAELSDRSRRLASALARQGVGVGDYVSIALPNSPEFMVAAVAVWRLGAVPQPLSPKMTERELGAVADLVQPAGIIGAEIGSHRVLSTDTSDDEPSAVREVSPYWKAPTSGGSTGRPKVIVATAPAYADNALPFGDLLHMPVDGAMLIPGPLHHNAPFMFCAVGLLRGNHVVLQRRFDAEDALRLVAAERISWVYAVPTMMQRIVRLDDEQRLAHDLGSLERVVHMAAPCPPWLKRAWIDWLGPETVVEIYAGTEAQAVTRIDGAEWLDHPGSVGRVILGEMEVRRDDGSLAGPDEIGSIWLRRGPGAPAPYFYIGAQARSTDDGWECLGDVGRLDAGGYLHLSDRDTDMFTVGGANVYPAEIEGVLDEHPAVLGSCVVGLPHPDLGAVPHAIVQLSEPVTPEELTAFAADRLSSYKVPRTVEVVDQALRDDAGKVRRSALAAERRTSLDPTSA